MTRMAIPSNIALPVDSIIDCAYKPSIRPIISPHFTLVSTNVQDTATMRV